MIDINESVVIGKPVTELYAYVSDQCNLPQWQKSVTCVEGPDGPIKKGARYTSTRKLMGKEVEAAYEIDDVKPNTSFGLHSIDKSPVKMRVKVEFHPVENGTRMSTNMQAEVGGFFKVAEDVVAKQLRDQLCKDELELKLMMEKKMDKRM